MGGNIRRVRTQRQIYRAAGKLLANVPFEKLKTSQIAEEAMISRSGFYLYFSDKTAMITAYLEYLGKEIETLYGDQRGNIDCMNGALQSIVNFLYDEELFASLLGSHSSSEVKVIVHEHMYDTLVTFVSAYCEAFAVDFSQGEKMDYYYDIVVDTFLVIFRRCFERRQKETVDEIADMLRNFLLAFMSIAPVGIGTLRRD